MLLGGHSAGEGHEPISDNIPITILVTIGKVIAFIAFMLIVGKRLLPKLLWWVAGTGSRELFNLCVIATAVHTAQRLCLMYPSRWVLFLQA